jgi:hypothetical protein
VCSRQKLEGDGVRSSPWEVAAALRRQLRSPLLIHAISFVPLIKNLGPEATEEV